MSTFINKYEFDNFDEYRFKVTLKNGAKFKFLDVYFEYYFLPKDDSQLLLSCYYPTTDENIATEKLTLANKVLGYIFTIPISLDYIHTASNKFEENIPEAPINIAKNKLDILNFVSNKVSKFNNEKLLFSEVINLHDIALMNLINDRNEDAILYYFKIIEKLAKKNFIKFHERNYTNAVKKNNKNKLKTFLKDFLKSNLKITMTEDMLNTATDEIYKKIRYESYNSIFLKISFFCQCKNISIPEKDLRILVKTRNKLAHGDIVKDATIHKALQIAVNLSQNFISTYFFRTTYNNISIYTHSF